MNITHYCSKCQCYHADVPCKFVTWRVFACAVCEESPCCCPNEEYTADWVKAKIANTAREFEMARVEAAINETVPHLTHQQLGSSTLDTWLDEGDLFRALAWGVVL